MGDNPVTGDLAEYSLSERPLSLAEALEGHQLPVLVETCGNQELDCRPDYDDRCLPLGSLLLLERRDVVTYAHLKVRDVNSEADTIRDKGAEFSVEYNGFVGEEILLPLGYRGAVKVIHPPRRRTRYAIVSEIITDFPRYIRVNIDTKTTPPADSEVPRMVRKGTVLEITNVIKRDFEHMDYLEAAASDGTKYVFREDTIVNFTAVPDENQYVLSDVVSMYLPKVVKFVTETTMEEAVSGSSTWVNNTLVMTYANMELLGTQQRDLYVGWLRDHPVELSWLKGVKNYKIALVPKCRCKSEMVKLVKFPTVEERQTFLERNFPILMETKFIANSLYVMMTEETAVTCLNSGAVMKEIRKPVTQELLSPDSGVKENPYDEPAPPIPERRPIRRSVSASSEEPSSPSTKGPSLGSEIMHKIRQKTRMGFDQVHKQLIQLVNYDKKKKMKAKLERHHSLERDKCPVKKQAEVSRTRSDAGDKRVVNNETRKNNVRNVHDTRPLPAIPMNREPLPKVEGNNKYDYIEIPSEKFNSKYEKLSPEEEAFIMRPNQTMTDFCSYSVRQVSDCFRLCAMDSFSEVCDRERMDGAFLASFDLQDLRKSPFDLTEFQIRKVRLIIHDGWRPLYETVKHANGTCKQ